MFIIILILSLLEASIVKYNKEKKVKALYIFSMLYLCERNLPAAVATYQKIASFRKICCYIILYRTFSCHWVDKESRLSSFVYKTFIFM